MNKWKAILKTNQREQSKRCHYLTEVDTSLGVSSISPGEGETGRHICQTHPLQLLHNLPECILTVSRAHNHMFFFFNCSSASFYSCTFLSVLCAKFQFILMVSQSVVGCQILNQNCNLLQPLFKMMSRNFCFLGRECTRTMKTF